MTNQAKGPGGRPECWTPEIALAICDRLAQGEPLKRICDDEGMPSAVTVRGWVLDDKHGFFALSARAYSFGYDAIAEDCLAIADDGSNDWIKHHDPENTGYAQNGEAIQRSKLRIETRMRLLGKWAKHKYGDAFKAELTGKDGGPIETKDISENDIARRIAFALAKGLKAE